MTGSWHPAAFPQHAKDTYACLKLSNTSKERFYRLLADSFTQWRAWFAGQEVALASRAGWFLDPTFSLAPKLPRHRLRQSYLSCFYWADLQGIRLVNSRYLSRDQLDVPLVATLADSIFDEAEEALQESLDICGLPRFEEMGLLLINGTAVTTITENTFCTLPDSLRIEYGWLTEMLPQQESVAHLINDNFTKTTQLVGTLLTLDLHPHEALRLLDLWRSGNIPIGIDAECQLVVLHG